MDEPGSPRQGGQTARELMGQATLERVRGQLAQALQLAQRAVVLEEGNWETHELMGDLLLGLGRGAEALKSFHRARELNPHRVELEDRVARAAVLAAERLRGLEHAQAVLEGRAAREPARKPAHAAVLSALLPGMGQIYNGQFGKGSLAAGAYLGLCLAAARAVRTQTSFAGSSGPASAPSLLGAAALWLGLLLALWVYAVVDAVRCAARTRPSSDSL